MKEIHDKLSRIQTKLVAPKGQTNSFGNYKYRSCEDILSAVKPLLKEEGCVLTITDEIVLIGDRYYVKAKATIICGEDSISTLGFARESESKKGMDLAQITGAASSYARKYALNGLLAIDDTKDADSTNNNVEVEKITDKDKSNILDMVVSVNSSEGKLLKHMGLEKLEDMPKADYQKAMAALEAKGKESE